MSNTGGERTQIAQIAVELSAKVFTAFGWTQSGTSDHNFQGFPVVHDTKGKPSSDEEDAPEEISPPSNPPETPAPSSPVAAAALVNYPADAVYYYPDPYFSQRTYVHFDFKSYAQSTIKPATLRKDLQRLGDSITAAETSSDWSAKFAPEQTNYNIYGGLFVHNHDEQALERFNTYLSKLGSASIRLGRGKRLFVFTPAKIIYLNSVVADLAVLRGSDVLPRPSEGETLFFYPYGVRYKPQNNLLKYASAESLLAPILIVRYRFSDQTKGQGYVVYYDGPGAEAEEFIFIFEALLKRRLLTGEDKIRVRMMNAVDNCQLIFKKAKEEFILFYHDLPIFRDLLNSVEYQRIDMVRPNYSTVELGTK